MIRVRGKKDFAGQQNTKTSQKKALVGVKQMFNRSCIPTVRRDPLWYFLAELSFSEGAHLPPSILTPNSFPPTSLPPCFSGYWMSHRPIPAALCYWSPSPANEEIESEHNLGLLVMLTQASQSTSLGNLTIQKDECSHMKIYLDGSIWLGAGTCHGAVEMWRGQIIMRFTDVREHLGKSYITSLLLIF